jgi:hypothetical protein
MNEPITPETLEAWRTSLPAVLPGGCTHAVKAVLTNTGTEIVARFQWQHHTQTWELAPFAHVTFEAPHNAGAGVMLTVAW